MGRRPNYGFQKRQKEIAKQKKKQERADKKRARKEAAGDSASGEDGGESQEESDSAEPRSGRASLDRETLARLDAVWEEGWDLWQRFDAQVRSRGFHPFVPADYSVVLEALLPLRAPGLRFLEWGSGNGVITIMADLLGFQAYGIEIDRSLVEQARDLARKTGSGARFVAGSFLPTGYRWRSQSGDHRLGTIEEGESGYLELGMPLEEFDIVFGYPWDGEQPMMLDLMRVHGGEGALFLLLSGTGPEFYRGGRRVALAGSRAVRS